VVGVLAIQGAFSEHCRTLLNVRIDGCDVEVVEVRSAREFEEYELDGLVIPGGESTAIALVARKWGVLDLLKDWVKQGKPVYGTCAGLIMLADSVECQKEHGQELIGGLDVTAKRNMYGKQISSFIAPLDIQDEQLNSMTNGFKGMFIRAPGITRVGENVQILASLEGDPVAVRQNSIMVTCFHPELTKSTIWHEYFIRHLILKQ